MGKLVLGILAVVALQIAFSIYFAMDGVPNEISETRLGPADQKHSIQIDRPARPVEPAPGTSAATALEPSTGMTATTISELPGVRVRTKRSSIDPANVRMRRVYRSVNQHSVKNTYRVHDAAADVARREYFGGMIVETSFRPSVARGTKLAKGKTRRLIFGRMSVEYKYAV